MPHARASKRRRTSAATSTKVLADPAHSVDQSSCLEKLWRAGSLVGALPAVLVLRASDGVEVLAGTEVAASMSRPIERMLVGPMKSATPQGVVSLPSVEGAALRSLVEYMYTGRLELTGDTIWSVLAAANFLQLGGAVRLCEPFLQELISPENVLSMARAGEEMNCGALRAEALDVAAWWFEDVVRAESFVELSEDEVRGLLRRDDLVVANEGVVYDSVLRWVDADASREAVFGGLFVDAEVVRLSQLSMERLEALRVSPRAGHEALGQGMVAEEMSRRLGGSEGTASRPRKYYAKFSDRVVRAELKRTMGEQVLNAFDMERVAPTVFVRALCC